MAMASRLIPKPDTAMYGNFTVVYLVFNTIMNLTTQAAQVACWADWDAECVHEYQ